MGGVVHEDVRTGRVLGKGSGESGHARATRGRRHFRRRSRRAGVGRLEIRSRGVWFGVRLHPGVHQERVGHDKRGARRRAGVSQCVFLRSSDQRFEVRVLPERPRAVRVDRHRVRRRDGDVRRVQGREFKAWWKGPAKRRRLRHTLRLRREGHAGHVTHHSSGVWLERVFVHTAGPVPGFVRRIHGRCELRPGPHVVTGGAFD
mmetsp:Transcript_5963/g.22553  ORF Transcript_5963/g.22553 Transcript_5963/m.22553 type:complete len:203 (-) Transcript_5963:1984-2592(-)